MDSILNIPPTDSKDSYLHRIGEASLSMGIFQDKKGFTVAELLVAALFGMIVVATLYGFFREQMFNLLAQETKTATLEDARGAPDLMVRELSNAGSFPLPIGYPTTRPANDDDGSNCERLVLANTNSNSIRVQADFNGDGDCSDDYEDITYAYSSGTIQRNSSTSPLVSNVVASNFLTYYVAGSTTAATPSSTNINAIKRVHISFAVQLPDPTPEGKAAGRKITSTLYSDVDFRN